MNSLGSPFSLGQLKDIPSFISPCANTVSQNGTLYDIAFSGVPRPKQCQPNETHGWFYGLPHYNQASNDVNDNLLQEKVPYFSLKQHETNTANPGSNPSQKRFLMFDQSGDQTTLFYSPGIGPPVQLTSEDPKAKNNCNTNKIVKTDSEFQHQDPNLRYEYDEKQRYDTESEMHEDTEEINALLYSDDDYYEDEEEASTGHSPSTMTDFRPNKRIKLSNGGFEVSPLVDNASSADPIFFSECEDDAKSSCGKGENLDLGDFGTLGKRKRSMKEHIRETVSLLQSIIPGGKGKYKDAILILDEAIDYLRSLKVKAQALDVRVI